MRGLLSSRPTSPVLPSSVPLLAAHNPGKASTSRGAKQVWHWVRLVGLGLATACLLRAFTPLGAVRLGGKGWSWSTHEDASCSSRGLEEWGSSNSTASIKIRVRPSPPTVDVVQARVVSSAREPIRGHSFHPQLAFSHYDLFPPVNQLGADESGVKAIPAPLPPSSCIEEATHLVDMLPAPDFSTHDPTFFFSYCTTPERAVTYGPTWTNFLGETASQRSGEARWTTSRPGCLIVDASDNGGPDAREKANEFLEKIGTTCVMQRSSRDGHRYEMRVLGLIQDAWEEAERRRADENGATVEWFVVGDDDSWFVGLGALKDTVRHKSSDEDHFLGGFSGAKAHFDTFGRIAYGGAGMIISRSLMKKMYDLLDTCAARFEPVVWGGDGLISYCAALARDVPLPEVVEEVPGLSQMDMRGDVSGFMSAGTPLISLHHWASWLDLIPNVSGLDAISLFTAGSNAIGGQNMFRRWAFDGGKTVWTAGYSVMIHESALTPDDLLKTEHTWNDYPPTFASRPARQAKLTYYITSVERISEDVTLFQHECHDSSVPPHLRKIQISWDEGRGLTLS